MANVVPSSLIRVIVMMEALHSSETSVLTRATRRNIPEDAILHSYRHENSKSYITKKPMMFSPILSRSMLLRRWVDFLYSISAIVQRYKNQHIETQINLCSGVVDLTVQY
jgi:hypothetical protein